MYVLINVTGSAVVYNMSSTCSSAYPPFAGDVISIVLVIGIRDLSTVTLTVSIVVLFALSVTVAMKSNLSRSL